MTKWEVFLGKKRYNSISLFSGAFGLDLGLERAGFETKACVEKDAAAVKTIIANKPHLKEHILQKDINDITAKDILKVANLKKGQVDLIAGGPPCQPFSTIGKRQSISSSEGKLFKKFLDIVWGIHPRFFIFENVKGIMSAAIRHRPLSKRKSRNSKLHEDELLGSAWTYIKGNFDKKLKRGKKNGYDIYIWELNAVNFGVPQKRKRVFVVGARKGIKLDKPKGKYTCKFRTIKEAIGHLEGLKVIPYVDFLPYDKIRTKIFEDKLIKAGENWTVLPLRLKKKVMGKGLYSTGGRVGFCRRLSWNSPSPTVTTAPNGRATNMCHPVKARPLTYKECALIQTFPERWKFEGSLSQKYSQIGNAVPVRLGLSVGKVLSKVMGVKNASR